MFSNSVTPPKATASPSNLPASLWSPFLFALVRFEASYFLPLNICIIQHEVAGLTGISRYYQNNSKAYLTLYFYSSLPKLTSYNGQVNISTHFIDKALQRPLTWKSSQKKPSERVRQKRDHLTCRYARLPTALTCHSCRLNYHLCALPSLIQTEL